MFVSASSDRCSLQIEIPFDRRTRIAFVAHDFATGGIQRCIAHLVNGLDPNRFEFQVISLSNDLAARDWIHNVGVEVTTLGKSKSNDPRVIMRLAGALREFRPDIMQSHNWGTLLESVVARRLARIPVHVHAERGTVGNSLTGRGLRNRMRGVAMRLGMEALDVVLSNSWAVASRVEERSGFSSKRIRIIPNGVDRPRVDCPVTARQEIRKQLGVEESALIVGSLGRLDAVKGFDVAIRATALALRERPDIHLLIVGDGPDRVALAALADELGIHSHVHLPGRREDIGRWLSAIDIYLNTSKSEGMSQAVLEAMSFGLPMIVTDVGDNAHLIGGEDRCGEVIQAENPGDLSSTLLNLAGRSSDLKQYSTNATSRFTQNYQRKSMLRQYEIFYSDLVKNHANSRR